MWRGTSGTGITLISASNVGYGLIIGNSTSEYLELSEVGQRIVEVENKPDKYEAIYDALFANSIFDALVSRYNDKPVPMDEVAIDYLKNTHNLSPEDGQACWDIFKDNLFEYDLVEELPGGRKVIISREAALQKLGKSLKKSTVPRNGNLSEEPPVGLPPANPLADKAKESAGHEILIPQFTFNIQIQLPDNASPETYNNIFKSIATHLLGRSER